MTIWEVVTAVAGLVALVIVTSLMLRERRRIRHGADPTPRDAEEEMAASSEWRSRSDGPES